MRRPVALGDPRAPLFLLLLMGGAAASGCLHGPTPATSFEFVDPAHRRGPEIDASKYTITERTGAFVDAKPIGILAPPKYPAAALHAQKLPVTVTVTVRVGIDGTAAYAGSSLAAVSIPSRFDADFRDEIVAAVAQWRFEPARLVHLEPRANDLPVVVDSEDVEDTFEVAFTFSPDGAVAAPTPKGR